MTPLCPPRGGPGRDDPPGGPGTWVLTLETQAPLLPLGTGLSSLLPEPKTGFQFHNQRHVPLTSAVECVQNFRLQSTLHVLFQHIQRWLEYLRHLNTQSARVPLREEERKQLSGRTGWTCQAGSGLKRAVCVILLVKGKIWYLCFQGEGSSLWRSGGLCGSEGNLTSPMPWRGGSTCCGTCSPLRLRPSHGRLEPGQLPTASAPEPCWLFLPLRLWQACLYLDHCYCPIQKCLWRGPKITAQKGHSWSMPSTPVQDTARAWQRHRAILSPLLFTSESPLLKRRHTWQCVRCIFYLQLILEKKKRDQGLWFGA